MSGLQPKMFHSVILDVLLQAAREEEAANRASMSGRDAFEELKRMAAATIAATPPGLRGAAPSGNGKEEEAATSGNGRRLPRSRHRLCNGRAPALLTEPASDSFGFSPEQQSAVC